MDAYSPDGNCRHRPSVDQMGGPWEASTCFHNPEWKVARIEERRKRNVRKPIHKNIRVHTHGRRHAGRQVHRQAGTHAGRYAGTQRDGDEERDWTLGCESTYRRRPPKSPMVFRDPS